MGKAQRDKGKRGELLWRNVCREHGFDAERGGQSNGKVIADVIGLPGIHQEVKFVEHLNLRAAMEQSVHDAKGEIPIVAHKMSRKPWLVTLTAEDWFKMYKAWNDCQGGALDGRM